MVLVRGVDRARAFVICLVVSSPPHGFCQPFGFFLAERVIVSAVESHGACGSPVVECLLQLFQSGRDVSARLAVWIAVDRTLPIVADVSKTDADFDFDVHGLDSPVFLVATLWRVFGFGCAHGAQAPWAGLLPRVS